MNVCCFLVVENWSPIVLILDHILQVPHIYSFCPKPKQVTDVMVVTECTVLACPTGSSVSH